MRNFHLLILILILSLVSACTFSPEKETTRVEIDGLNRRVLFPQNPQHVMGLSPSVTEMLAFLLPVDRIIGKTVLCDYPKKILSLPSVVVYPDVDIEKIIKLKPDIVFTVEGMTPLSTASKFESLGIPVYYFSFHQLEDVFRNLLKMSSLLNVKNDNKIDFLRSHLQIDTTFKTNLKVLGIVSVLPMYVYGKHSMLSDQLLLSGASNVMTTHESENYPMISVEELLKLNPDVLVTSGDVLEAKNSLLAAFPQLIHLPCIQQDRIISLDGNLLSRPGPRSVDCVLELRKQLSKLVTK